MVKKCSAKNCDRDVLCKSMCERHYRKMRHHKYPHIKATKRKYYDAHREEILEKGRKLTKKWAEENKERKKIKDKKYYERVKNTPEYRNKKNQNYRNYFNRFGENFDMSYSQVKLALYNWGKIVRSRDRTCQICDSANDLVSHHILYKKLYPQLAFNENNGIALCQSCHKETHGWLTQ